MTIILTNTSGSVLEITDLGVYLEDAESLDLNDSFTYKTLIESSDLETSMDASDCTVEIDSESVNHDQLIERLTALTRHGHTIVDTLTHNLSETAFFETTKDVDGLTQYINYYTDDQKTTKIYEEEITRDGDNKVASIIRKQYDINGNLIKSETQTLIRDVDGRVTGIDIGIS